MIKIEVTGNSIAEVADKLLAIGGSLRAPPATQHIDAPFKLNAIMPELIDEVVFVPDVVVGPAPEAAGAAPVDPTPSQPTPETSAPSSTTSKTSTEKSSEPTPPASASVELDFDKDVAPHVLMLVKEKGKPAAQEILSQFGVDRASLLDPVRWPELVEMLKEAL